MQRKFLITFASRFMSQHRRSHQKVVSLAVARFLVLCLGTFLLTSLFIAATSASAWAGEDASLACDKNLSAAARQDSQTLTMHGVACFEAHKYDWALSYYLKAYAIDPEPFLLGGIGRSLHELGLYEPALDYYYQFLSHDEVPSGAERIRQRVDELEEAVADDEKTATVSLDSAPSGAEAFVVFDNDERYSLGSTPVEVELREGHYEFVFEDEDYLLRRFKTQVASGENNEIYGGLLLEPPAVDRRRRAGGWTMAGAVVPLAAGATMLTLSAQETSAARTLEDDFEDLDDFDSRRQQHLDSASSYRLWGTVSAAVGATALLTGTILYFSAPASTSPGPDGEDSELSRNLEVEPTLGLNHLGLRLQF